MVQRSRPASVDRDYTVSSRTNIWISTKPYTQLIFPVVRQRKTDCLGYRTLFPRDVFSNWFGCYWWFCKFGQNEVERSKFKVVTRPGQKGGGTTTVEFYLVNVFSQSIIQHFLTLLVNKSADSLQPRCQAWGMRVKPPKCCLPPSWNILVKKSGGEMCEIFVMIVFAVKICRKMSTNCFSFRGTSSDLADPLPGLRP